MPLSSSLHGSERTEGGIGRRPAWRGGGRRWSWPRRRPGNGATRRGGRGYLIPVLTLDRGGARRELHGRRRTGGGGAWGGANGGRWVQSKLARCGVGRRGGRHRPFIGPEGRFRGKNLPGDLGGDSGEVGHGGRRGEPWCCLDWTRRAGAAGRGSSSQRRGGRRWSRRCC
jgi:hypothetical protein